MNFSGVPLEEPPGDSPVAEDSPLVEPPGTPILSSLPPDVQAIAQAHIAQALTNETSDPLPLPPLPQLPILNQQ